MTNGTKDPLDQEGRVNTPAPTIVKREVVPIQLALAIGVAIVSIIATFFATRADLSSRINDVKSGLERLEKRLEQANIQKYLERTKIYTQITNLKIIEAEIDRLKDFVDRWKPPEIKYGRKLPFPTPNPLDKDVVVETKSFEGGPVKLYDQSLLGNVVSSVDTRGIPDTEIMPNLHHIVLRLNKYNSQVMGANIGVLKENAQNAINESENDIQFIKTLLPGLRQKVIDCRNDIEDVLKDKPSA